MGMGTFVSGVFCNGEKVKIKIIETCIPVFLQIFLLQTLFTH